MELADQSSHFDLSSAVSLFGFVSLIALIPFALVLMTSFTRISIVLTFLRQAFSTSVPSTQIIIGLSIILTGYVMHPVLNEVYENALVPYFESEKKNEKELVEKAWPSFRNFMLTHTREKDLELFLHMGKVEFSTEKQFNVTSIPWYCVIPAFVISELRIAFLMGFLLFLPFLIIDLVVTSILMSLGMVMLPPVMISFPFKILLFIAVDGWRLVVHQVVQGYA